MSVKQCELTQYSYIKNCVAAVETKKCVIHVRETIHFGLHKAVSATMTHSLRKLHNRRNKTNRTNRRNKQRIKLGDKVYKWLT